MSDRKSLRALMDALEIDRNPILAQARDLELRIKLIGKVAETAIADHPRSALAPRMKFILEAAEGG